MQTPLPIAIIGCGWAGTRHAEALARIDGAEVRWAVDLDLNRAEALAAGHPTARTTTNYHEALADLNVIAVDICLPHALHAQVAVTAADAGKHILCEKPIAGSLDDADRMAASAERAGVVLMVAENVRFEPLYAKVRDLLDDGVIGKPALIQMTRQGNLTRSFIEERSWFLDAKTAAGGIMMSGGIHDVETMRLLIGEIESIYAISAPQRFTEMEGDDTSVALIRFVDGTVGTLVESFVAMNPVTATGAELQTLQIDGDHGSLTVSGDRTIDLYSEHPSLSPGETPAQQDIHVPEADTFALEIEHFLDAIRTGREPITSGRSQRRTLEIVLAAYQSMQTGQPVQLPTT